MLTVVEPEQLPVAQAKAGDAGAWDALFRRYQLPLYAYVRELVRNEQTALDIVQETFINATRHVGRLADNERFGSWLFSIAHQKVVQHWRRQPQRDRVVPAEEQTGLAEPESAEPNPSEQLIAREQEAELWAILEQLPPAHKAVLLLHYLEDFPLETIAEITATEPGTVKSRLHYARKSLRKLMEEKQP
jgi:RNA polymerase sigma-70 factor (ECF subfamily)